MKFLGKLLKVMFVKKPITEDYSVVPLFEDRLTIAYDTNDRAYLMKAPIDIPAEEFSSKRVRILQMCADSLVDQYIGSPINDESIQHIRHHLISRMHSMISSSHVRSLIDYNISINNGNCVITPCNLASALCVAGIYPTLMTEPNLYRGKTHYYTFYDGDLFIHEYLRK